MKVNNRKSAFISYSQKDRSFARRLQIDLESNGLLVWFDEKEIEPGDSIVGAIDQGLGRSDHFLMLISQASSSSAWVRREYESALSLQLSSGNKLPKIIPILIDSTKPPTLLSSLKWLSFRDSYVEGVIQLGHSLGLSKPYIRTDRLLQEFEQVKQKINELSKGEIYPSHDFFDKVEVLEDKFNELRRIIASIQPLNLDRRYWLLGDENTSLRDRSFDLEYDSVEILKVNVHMLAEKMLNYSTHPDFFGILSYPSRRFFGASCGGDKITWYMHCAGSGIFRDSPYNGASTYVSIGSPINSKTILCRIESGVHSQEMLSTIADGILTEICVKDGESIDDRTILFRGIHSAAIEPAE